MFRWAIGLTIAAYLLLASAMNIPFVQKWLAGVVANALAEKLDTSVGIGRIQLGFDGRIIVDNVVVDDRQGVQMLRVSRLGTKLNVWQLLEGRIRIGNVQLFGARAELYQTEADGKPNFWFVVDALASKDTTQSFPLDLRIGQIVVRRTGVRWEQRWKDETPGTLNTGHISIDNLNITAELNALTADTLNLHVRRLDAEELLSGLCVRELSFAAAAGRQGITIDGLHLALPHSTIDAPRLACGTGADWKSVANVSIHMEGQVDSHDLAPLSPILAEVDDEVSFSLRMGGEADNIVVEELRVSDLLLAADVRMQGSVRNAAQGAEHAVVEADILSANVNPAAATQYANTPILTRIGEVRLSGPLTLQRDRAAATIDISTIYGDIHLTGTADRDGSMAAEVNIDSLHIGRLLDNGRLGTVALTAEANGSLGSDMRVKASIPLLEYGGYDYRNIELNGTVGQNQRYDGNISLDDPNITLHGSGKADLRLGIYEMNANVATLAPNALNLTTRFPDTRFSGSLIVDIKGNLADNMDGIVHINNFCMEKVRASEATVRANESNESSLSDCRVQPKLSEATVRANEELRYRPGDLHITAAHEEGKQRFTIISPFLEAQVDGKFKPKNLMGDFTRLLGTHAPTFFPTTAAKDSDEYCTFMVKVYDTRPLHHLLGVDVGIDNHTVVVEGSMDMDAALLGLTAKAPRLTYGKEDLKDVSLRVEGYGQSLFASLQLRRLMKGKYIDLGIDATGLNNMLTTKFYWDNNSEQTPLRGDISMVSQFWQDDLGNYCAENRILPSSIVAGDSVWHVHPGAFRFGEGTLSVDSISISGGSHSLALNGRISKEETDTLHASLQNIELENVFSIFNFNAVELAGEATGNVHAHSLFSKPHVDAFVHVPQVSLNGGTIGDLDMYGNWGRREYSIYLDGDVSNATTGTHSYVRGYVTPKKDIAYHGIDLGIEADSLNIYFLNKYTHSVFDELRGHGTGYVHLFGPFKQLNVEGGVLVHEGSLGVPYLGVRYHVENDSVILTPNNIFFRNANLYDPQGNPSSTGHRARLDGHLTHNNFSNLHYDIGISADNLLAYNFPNFDNMPFCGTVLATGNVRINGSPGTVNIDVNAQPQQGTAITYDFTSPDNVEQSQLITYVDRNRQDTTETALKPQETTPAHDIRLNFDLDIDNNSTLKLLMDARSGDMITVNGSGHILAHYYNKGDMQMFGTYHIEKGTYNLSLQEIIRKNFDLQDGGTITFTGEPMNADINIQASHTVSGVSLNDISARSTFSNTSARVNCLMNISGKASQPRITFDFDILNVNEDEKQMVRSLISTEEERNMQVIYLLGIGRFYTYDYTTQTQSSTAMNSLLSSTLSGQINQMLSNMIGSSNWNFGANLNTGNTGWSDLDVEGMLQGSLLNDRLLINGNFGYRDNPVNSSNFIGDFDAQYRLTRSGSVNLKAYNKTNDRYFTKSSLTTQGIGVLLKKDFTSMWELFRKRAKKSKD